MTKGPGVSIYKAVHALVKWVFLLGAVLPIGLAFAAVWYLCFPLGVLVGLAVCDDTEEFAEGIRERYVRIPLEAVRDLFDEFKV